MDPLSSVRHSLPSTAERNEPFAISMDSQEDLFYVMDEVQREISDICHQLINGEPDTGTPLDHESIVEWKKLSKAYRKTSAGTESFEDDVAAHLESSIENVIQMLAENCRIQGQPWNEAPAPAAIKAMDPIDLNLQKKLYQAQADADLALSRVCKLRREVPAALASQWKALIKEICETVTQHLSTLTQVPETEELLALTLDFKSEMLTWEQDTELTSQHLKVALELVSHLISHLPQLKAKLERFQMFLQDELADDDKYHAHLARLETAREKRTLTGEALLMDKINASYTQSSTLFQFMD